MERIYAAGLSINDLAPGKSFTSFAGVVGTIAKNALTVAGIILLAFFVFGGFRVIMGAGSGDSKSLQEGQKAMTNAAIGFIIIFAAYWIVQIIGRIIGVDLI